MARFLTIIIVLILAGVGLFYWTAPDDAPARDFSDITPVSESDESLVASADFENKPTLLIGDPNAPITMTEYGDFKCPSCAQFQQEVGQELRNRYLDNGVINIEYRNYPFLGPDSGRSARGTYCANDQGVFSAYHDIVFDYMWTNYYSQNDPAAQRRDVLTTEKLIELMEDELTDQNQFRECVESDDYNRFLDADLLLGADDSINGTPGFVIGGQRIVGLSNITTFVTLIENERRNEQ
jgi:protein-disulfide isomerase